MCLILTRHIISQVTVHRVSDYSVLKQGMNESAKTESVAEMVALSVAIFDMVHWVRSISLRGLGKSSCVPQLPAVFIPAGKLHWGKPSHRALSYIYASWHHAVLHLLPSNVIPNRPWQWEKITWAYYEYKCVKYI